jgi:hypothetical protein
MSDAAVQIQELIKTSGKAAPAMTTALKRLGKGDMQSGITRIADYFLKEGVKVGTIRGAVGGVIGTVTIDSLILIIREAVKSHKSHKVEGEAILKELEESLAESEELNTADALENADNAEKVQDVNGNE